MTTSAGGPTPIISRVLPDGTLLETIYDAEECKTSIAVSFPSGGTRLEAQFTLSSGETLVPYSPHNNLLATECVLLPSGLGELRDKRDLVEQIRCYLRRYVDLTPVSN